jgi:ELWxxDGT repeat protein
MSGTQTFLVQGTTSATQGNADGSQLFVITEASNGAVTYAPGPDTFQQGLGSAPTYIVPFGGGFLVSAYGSVGTGSAEYTPTKGGTYLGKQLWFTDGTQTGTHLVADIYGGKTNGGMASPDPTNLTVLGSTAVFQASAPYTSAGGIADNSDIFAGLWTTDGTAKNTYQITGLYNVSQIVKDGSEAFVVADSGAKGVASQTLDVWLTDGTQAGTKIFSPFPMPAAPPSGYTAGADQDSPIYTVGTSSGGQEVFVDETYSNKNTTTGNTVTTGALWVLGGPSGGTRQLTSFQLPAGATTTAAINAVTGFGTGAVLFDEYGTQASQLWISNGAAAGTKALTTTLAASPKYITPFTTASGTQEAVFESGTQLWVTDGTPGGTHQIAGATPFGSGDSMFAEGHDVFFTANAGGNQQLWKTDGTTASVFDPAANIGAAYWDKQAGGELFFVTAGSSHYLGLSDGTAAGTHVTTIPSGSVYLNTIAAAPCFASGTRIATPRGAVTVEALRVGEAVMLADGGTAPVVWLGHRRVDCARHPRKLDVMPVRVRAHAFGQGLPHTDLVLSPDHAVLRNGHLIPVRYLVNGRTIVQEHVEAIAYWHVELPRHDVVLAEGLPVESYLDTGNRGAFVNGGPAVQLQPDFATRAWQANACAPLVLDGPRIAAARRRLLTRAKRLGHALTDDPDLKVIVAGRELPMQKSARQWRVRLPRRAKTIHVVSRRWIPAHTRPGENDTRSLGVAISRLWLDWREMDLASAGLVAGWHAPEPDWRWTDGDARLALTGVRELAFEIAMTGTYWRDEPASATRAA